jgi:hypothetical protein
LFNRYSSFGIRKLTEVLFLHYRRKRRTKEEHKVLHKAIERRRTAKINDLIEGLKAELEGHNKVCKKDKASILGATLYHIKDLQSDIASLKREKANLISKLNAPTVTS